MKLKFVFAIFTILLSGSAHAQITTPPPFPGGGPIQPIFSVWCQDHLAVLNQAEQTARQQYSMGHVVQAIATLNAGLHDAVQNTQTPYLGAMTVTALKRGLTLSNEVNKFLVGKPGQQKTLAFLLFKYYDFVRDVATNLDTNYYVPGSCGYCHNKGVEEFESEYIEYSKQQVELVLNEMTELNDGIAYPLGEAKAFLKGMELVTYWLSTDLSSSLFSNRYACEAAQLQSLSQRLSKYNKVGTEFQDDFDATQQSYASAQEIISSIGEQGCSSPHGGPHGGWSSAPQTVNLASPFYVPGGSTQSVQLARKTYVQKLIISAAGGWGDAIVDVVVNGDVKGTLYVPGLDPSYVVTVGAWATSIEFVSRSSSRVTINSIHGVLGR